MRFWQLIPLLVCGLEAGLGIHAYGATSFVEDFGGGNIGSNLSLGSGYGAPTTDFSDAFTVTSGNGSRIFLGTNDSDYSTVDFVFEADITITNPSDWSIPFFGIGTPDASASALGEPILGSHVLAALRHSNRTIRSKDNTTNTASNTEATVPGGFLGTHRAKLVWDAATQQALFELDLNSNGFVESSFTLDGSNNGFDHSNSHLIIGGGAGLSIDNISVSAATASVLEAQIDRSTGSLTLSNNGGVSAAIIGYTFSSSSGAFDYAAWTPIATNGDVDSGATLDDDQWIALSSAGSGQDLSEIQVGGEGPQDGVTLTAIQTINLGSVWLPSQVEDVQLELLLDDRTTRTIDVTYVNEVVLGDFDRNNVFDGADFLQFQRRKNRPFEQTDLLAWQASYGAANSALAAIIVPEPPSIIFLVLASCCVLILSRQRWIFSCGSHLLTFCAFTCIGMCVANQSVAQTPAAPILSSYRLELETFATHTEFQAGNGSNPVGVGQQFGAIDVTAPRDGSRRVFVSTQPGKILAYDSAGNSLGDFLDLAATAGVTGFSNNNGAVAFRGLMYFDFHPDYAVPGAAGEGKVYTGYAVNSGYDSGGLNADYRIQDYQSRSGSNQYAIAEWQVNSAGNAIDTNTFREVYRFQTEGSNPHGLGEIAFNPYAEPDDEDYGLLYAAIGDGNAQGNAAPATGYLQELDNPYGKIVRINPLQAGEDAYSVPASNPFVGQLGAAEEVYALGFRDQQTFSFAQDSNNETVLITFDIGAAEREEVSLVRAGGNYGWERYEGSLDFAPGVALAPASPIHSPPVLEYVHSNDTGGFAIIGGLLVSDPTDPNFQDKVIFSDLPNGKLFYADYAEMLQAEMNGTQAQIYQVNQFMKDGTLVTEDGTANGGLNGLVSFEDVYGASRGDARFGTDEAGNVFIATKQSGEILKTGLVAATGRTPLLNGILGDVNQDGTIAGGGSGPSATDDISAFRAGWLSSSFTDVVDQFTHGDMNFDGVTNLLDALILHEAFTAAGTPISLHQLIVSKRVPEPSTLVLGSCLTLLGLLMRVQRNF